MKETNSGKKHYKSSHKVFISGAYEKGTAVITVQSKKDKPHMFSMVYST